MRAFARGPKIAATRRTIAAGNGWRVCEVVVEAGPKNVVLEERHEFMTIAAVLEGSFGYRSTQGAAVLTPGALLLGNGGDPFECSYEHTAGDRCISLYYTPEYLERVAQAVPAARTIQFHTHKLPPTPAITALAATMEAESVTGCVARLEEMALHVAGTVCTLLAGKEPSGRQPSRRDEKRVLETVRIIKERFRDRLSVAELASAANMSPYHFLRTFRDVVGVTPYRFVVQTRLRHAAVQIATTGNPISAIAFDTGFGDLSTFVTTFRRAFGLAPGDYRERRQHRYAEKEVSVVARPA